MLTVNNLPMVTAIVKSNYDHFLQSYAKQDYFNKQIVVYSDASSQEYLPFFEIENVQKITDNDIVKIYTGVVFNISSLIFNFKINTECTNYIADFIKGNTNYFMLSDYDNMLLDNALSKMVNVTIEHQKYIGATYGCSKKNYAHSFSRFRLFENLSEDFGPCLINKDALLNYKYYDNTRDFFKRASEKFILNRIPEILYQ